MESDIYGPTNIGNPHEQSMLELARLIIELTDSKSEIFFQELPLDDPKLRNPDIGKAKSEMKWEPEVSITEGLKKTIAYFQAII